MSHIKLFQVAAASVAGVWCPLTVAKACWLLGKLTSIRRARRSVSPFSTSQSRSVGPVSPLYATLPWGHSITNPAASMLWLTCTARTVFPATTVGFSVSSSRYSIVKPVGPGMREKSGQRTPLKKVRSKGGERRTGARNDERSKTVASGGDCRQASRIPDVVRCGRG